MGWEEYRKGQVTRITLESIGLPEFWIDVRKPGTYTLAELAVIEKLGGENAGANEFKEAIPIIIVDWNLTNPSSGEALEIPNNENSAKSLEVLPMDVFRVIGDEMGKLMEKMPEEIIPEKPGT